MKKKLNKNEKQVTSTVFFDEKFIRNQMNQVKIVQVDIHICSMIRGFNATNNDEIEQYLFN